MECSTPLNRSTELAVEVAFSFSSLDKAETFYMFAD